MCKQKKNYTQHAAARCFVRPVAIKISKEHSTAIKVFAAILHGNKILPHFIANEVQ